MLKHLVVLSALAIGSVAVAHADSISGTLAAYGNDSFTASSISFLPGGRIAGGPGANTLTFSILTTGNPVNFFPTFPPGTPLPYSQGLNMVPSAISPVELFTTTEGGVTFDFFMTEYNASLVSNVTGCTSVIGSATCLDVTGNGFFTATGFSNSPGSFTFTSQELTGQTSTTFSGSAIATPIPEPASLALFGTGMLGLVGFARRKFNV